MADHSFGSDANAAVKMKIRHAIDDQSVAAASLGAGRLSIFSRLKWVMLVPLIWIGCTSFVWVPADQFGDVRSAEYHAAQISNNDDCWLDTLEGRYYPMRCVYWDFWPCNIFDKNFDRGFCTDTLKGEE